ncbi:zinc finger protein 235-like [Artemia franciscana]|uniref:zinc finger protein 235-like n=1 Tax=Artemia franciscana TaxID=6661 RepID=UPI0032DB6AEC
MECAMSQEWLRVLRQNNIGTARWIKFKLSGNIEKHVEENLKILYASNLPKWSHFSPHLSGLHSQGNTSPVVSKDPSTSCSTKSSALECEATGLENQETCLNSRLQIRKLEGNQRTHTGKNAFKCEICHKMFSLPHVLNRHQEVHTGEKPFKCDVCDKSFSRSYVLNQHQRVHTASLNTHRRVHTGKKPFKCDVCDKTFSQAVALDTHQRVHTGEKPFKCDVCNKSFSRADVLNLHQRVHTGAKPFKCHICDKNFSQAAALNTHQRLHTGEGLFKCNVCDKTYSQAASLKAHHRLYTGTIASTFLIKILVPDPSVDSTIILILICINSISTPFMDIPQISKNG